MIRLIRLAFLLSVTALLASCATQPSTALQIVESAIDPVHATLAANSQMRACLYRIKAEAPTAHTSTQCAALLNSYADAAEACVSAYKNVAKLETITAIQGKMIRRSFRQLDETSKQCLPEFEVLLEKSKPYLRHNDVGYSFRRVGFWLAEWDHHYNKISRKAFTIQN